MPTLPAAPAVFSWRLTTIFPIPKTSPSTKEQKEFLKNKTFYGNEIVAGARRLALMNMFLHNIGDIDSETFILSTDSLIADTGLRVDYVLTNPPFGKKSSMTFTNEEGEQEKEDLTYNRQDFWATTSNKQLNFVQHIRTMLKTSGKAAVVVPDNVFLKAGRARRSEKTTGNDGSAHHPAAATGIFYAQGVKANVFLRQQTGQQRPLDTERSGYTITAPTSIIP